MDNICIYIYITTVHDIAKLRAPAPSRQHRFEANKRFKSNGDEGVDGDGDGDGDDGRADSEGDNDHTYYLFTL